MEKITIETLAKQILAVKEPVVLIDLRGAGRRVAQCEQVIAHSELYKVLPGARRGTIRFVRNDQCTD